MATQENNIVDCDLLEAAKENVQPLAVGRRVTALSTILATPHVQRDAKLSATRNRLRINVELALDDEEADSLEAYCSLVYWTVENYPQGHSAESGLLELLEEATRVLKDDRDGKWRDHLKYLKLWVLYASYVERPDVIYRFLMANEIGTNHALLYEEHAAILERDGRRTEADNAYAVGIARQAMPIDRLKAKHREFQKRMMSTALLPAVPTPPPISSVAQRTVLGAPSRITASTASSSRTALSREDSLTTHRPASSIPNARLQIFVDPSGSESRSPENHTNVWPDLGTRKTRVKENVPEVKKLGGTTLKQAGKSKRVASGSGSGIGAGIVPYRDPHPDAGMLPISISQTPFADVEGGVPTTPKFMPFRDETATPALDSHAIPDSVMKVKHKGIVAVSQAEALRKDPLKNYEIESGVE